jgi:hypothetical protein
MPFIFGWRLAGWLSRSLPQRLNKSRIVPPGPGQECSQQTGANKIKTNRSKQNRLGDKA